MLTVLWAVVVVSTVVLATALAGRDAFDAGRNRVSATRAFWHASDCAERARLVIENALSRSDAQPARTWRTLDAAVLSDPLATTTDCETQLEATGTRLDVNAGSSEELTRLFTALGREDSDALLEAVEDWRDDDNDPRPNGAEASWYAARQRFLPRNGPIANELELSRIRGLEDGSAEQFLSVEQIGRAHV